jgi:hypothetical protein
MITQSFKHIFSLGEHGCFPRELLLRWATMCPREHGLSCFLGEYSCSLKEHDLSCSSGEYDCSPKEPNLSCSLGEYD